MRTYWPIKAWLSSLVCPISLPLLYPARPLYPGPSLDYLRGGYLGNTIRRRSRLAPGTAICPHTSHLGLKILTPLKPLPGNNNHSGNAGITTLFYSLARAAQTTMECGTLIVYY